MDDVAGRPAALGLDDVQGALGAKERLVGTVRFHDPVRQSVSSNRQPGGSKDAAGNRAGKDEPLVPLANQAETDRPFWWHQAEQARARGEPLVLVGFGRILLDSRDCRDRQLSPAERARKQFDYFFLARDAEKDPKTGDSKAVTGRDLASIRVVSTPAQGASIYFGLTRESGDRFYDLTSDNAPDPGAAEPFTSYLAVVIDGQILTAPRLNTAIRAEGVIEGRFTLAEAERLATMLRAGALPDRLRPLPVAEVMVEPRARGK